MQTSLPSSFVYQYLLQTIDMVDIMVGSSSRHSHISGLRYWQPMSFNLRQSSLSSYPYIASVVQPQTKPPGVFLFPILGVKLLSQLVGILLVGIWFQQTSPWPQDSTIHSYKQPSRYGVRHLVSCSQTKVLRSGYARLGRLQLWRGLSLPV